QQTLSLADCLAKRCRSRPTQPAQATGENKPRRPLLLFLGHPRSRLSWGQGSASHYEDRLTRIFRSAHTSRPATVSRSRNGFSLTSFSRSGRRVASAL